jgi:hypothetical protein
MRNYGRWISFALLLLCSAAPAQTPPPAAPAPENIVAQAQQAEAPNQAGVINLAEGDARIIATGAKAGPAKVGDIVNEGDVLVTGKDGEIHLTMQDTGFIALRPNTRLKVASYKADGGDDDHAIFRLIAGGFRSVTGWIGKYNPRSYKVHTLTATIGIRGTDHEPHYIPEGSTEGAPGTYDKVYVGSTVIGSSAGETSVAPAQAGFAPLSGRERPRVLARVPGFFKPSRYEPMIEKKHDEIQRMIQQRREERRKIVAEKRAALQKSREQTKALMEQNKAAAEKMRESTEEKLKEFKDKRGDVQESAKAAAQLRKDAREKRIELQKDYEAGKLTDQEVREREKALREERKAARDKQRETGAKRKALEDEQKAAAEKNEQAREARKKALQEQVEATKAKRQDLENEREDMQKELKGMRQEEAKRYREELKAARKKETATKGADTNTDATTPPPQ